MNNDKWLENLTDEQRAMAKDCKSPEEFLKLAGAEGIDLTDEQMDSISGGWNRDEEAIKYPTDGDCNEEQVQS